MTTATGSAVEHELALISGKDNIAEETRDISGVLPVIAVSPRSAEEVAAIVNVANQRNLVIAPAGGFTRQQIGGAPERVDILLRTDRLNRVRHYDSGDLTIGVDAGLSFGEMQRCLAEHRQWIPFDPCNGSASSVGGLLATAPSGPLKSGHGGLRDFCIGVEFVTGDGIVAKGGGRVVKNVAGYDLMKLLIGSYGSLAVITGANFKVFPEFRQTRTFVCAFASLTESLMFRTQVLNSPLSTSIACMEIVSPKAPEYLREMPVAHDPDDYAPSEPLGAVPGEWEIALRFSGSEAVLARCSRELGAAVSRELAGAEETKFWHWISQFEESVLQRHRNALVIYANVAINDAGSAIEALERSAPDYNFLPAVVGRAATGNLIMGLVPLPVEPPNVMQYANCVSAFRGLLPPGSSAMVARCPKEAKGHFDLWGGTPTDVKLMRQIKQALDPKNVLNRGRFIV
ncbi:MAG TPA: FAD-binding oxidoreductase [Candidatus Angelobacter sp.]|nr:FAD-binding oxidoreductase [Candidatus Angelobacter sp.]